MDWGTWLSLERTNPFPPAETGLYQTWKGLGASFPLAECPWEPGLVTSCRARGFSLDVMHRFPLRANEILEATQSVGVGWDLGDITALLVMLLGWGSWSPRRRLPVLGATQAASKLFTLS